DEGFGKTSRAAELHNRKELWDVRAEIDKEKLRHVAPFPFFGRAMRFQDEFAALQITDDGRFSYSFVGLNYEARAAASCHVSMSVWRPQLNRNDARPRKGAFRPWFCPLARCPRPVARGWMALLSPSFPPGVPGRPLRCAVHEKLRRAGGLTGLGGLEAVQFRPLRKKDRSDLEALHAEWFPVDYSRSFYDEVFEQRSVGSVAAVGGENLLLGAATFRTKFQEPRFDMDSVLEGGAGACMSGRAGYVLTLGVVDGARGHGLAKALLEKSFEAIRRELPEVEAIWVHVVCYNLPAQALYERMGLVLVRRFPRFYSFYDQIWDSFLYVLYEKNGKPPDLRLEVLKDELLAMAGSWNHLQALRLRCQVWAAAAADAWASACPRCRRKR
ncbi:unnamed protein product, partial [Effrenium voratum]